MNNLSYLKYLRQQLNLHLVLMEHFDVGCAALLDGWIMAIYYNNKKLPKEFLK